MHRVYTYLWCDKGFQAFKLALKRPERSAGWPRLKTVWMRHCSERWSLLCFVDIENVSPIWLLSWLICFFFSSRPAAYKLYIDLLGWPLMEFQLTVWMTRRGTGSWKEESQRQSQSRQSKTDKGVKDPSFLGKIWCSLLVDSWRHVLPRDN